MRPASRMPCPCAPLHHTHHTTPPSQTTHRPSSMYPPHLLARSLHRRQEVSLERPKTGPAHAASLLPIGREPARGRGHERPRGGHYHAVVKWHVSRPLPSLLAWAAPLFSPAQLLCRSKCIQRIMDEKVFSIGLLTASRHHMSRRLTTVLNARSDRPIGSHRQYIISLLSIETSFYDAQPHLFFTLK